MGAGPRTKYSMVATQFLATTLTNSKQVVFAGQGNIWRLLLENNTATVAYVQFFDALTASVTLGSTTPNFTIMIPVSGQVYISPDDLPLQYFANGCVVACTTSRTNATAPASAANAIFWFEA